MVLTVFSTSSPSANAKLLLLIPRFSGTATVRATMSAACAGSVPICEIGIFSTLRIGRPFRRSQARKTGLGVRQRVALYHLLHLEQLIHVHARLVQSL